MNFELTKENENYIKSRGKVILNACPGSGKTTAIAYKLTTLTTECTNHFSNYSGVACLSFTNVAKDEISDKFESISSKRLTYPHLTSTIDSFINKYITLPFYHLLGFKSKRPTILNTVDFLDNLNLEWIRNKQNRPLKYSYPPKDLKIEIDGSYSWKRKKLNTAIIDNNTFQSYAKKYKNWQFENGYINNDDSTYLALKLLESFPQIGNSLVQRFPYIIIDEAQDTSELQYIIFEELIKCGLSNIEYIGDPYQSLYEFREARPDLFIKKYEDTTTWNAIELATCRRSSQKIINLYNTFRKSSEKPITSTCKHKSDFPIKIIKYDENNLDALVSEYTKHIDITLPYQILVRGSSHLEMFGVKQTQENPWKNAIARDLILASYNYEVGKIKDCINTLRKVYVQLHFPEKDYKEKLEKENGLREDFNLNIKLFDFIKNCPSTDDTLEVWTSNTTAYIKAQFGIDIDLELKKKGKAYYSQNLRILMYPETVLQYPVSTIHKVKGMTFNSILLILSDNSSGEKLSISDFTKPLNLPNEKQRMIYVALSRPETFACIAVPNKIDNKEIIDKLGVVEIIE